MKRSLPALLAVLCGNAVATPVILSPGSLTYTQNFDALATADNNAPSTSAWADDSTIPGWWWYIAANAAAPTGLAGPAFAYYVGDGNAAPNTAPLGHGFYSLGVIDSPDRTMGTSSTTALGEISSIVILQNMTAGPLKLSNMKFTAEAWRTNTTANNRDSLFVWYKTALNSADLLNNTTALATSNPTVFSGTTSTAPTSYYITGWTNLPEYTYTSTNATAGLPLPPETQAFNAAPSSVSVVVQAGDYIALRWSNINDGGADALIGLDDLELTFVSTSPCVVDATVTGITRLPGANPGSAVDDSVQFTINTTAVSGSPGGWKVPAGGLAGGTVGAYTTPVVITAPIADFGAAGTATLRVEDSVETGCFDTVTVSAPPFIQKVTTTSSPAITFTPAPVGTAAYVPPAADQSELGWNGGAAGANTASNVQMQPDSGVFIGTNRYWHLTTATTTFTTDPVDVSAVAGQILEGRINLAFYSTSTTGLEAADVLNARMEVALDGDFNNVAVENILTEVFVDEPGVATDIFAGTIPAAATYIDLNVVGYPAEEFTFFPFTKTISIPPGATNARARILFSSGAGISNSEHVLLDNVRFSLLAGATDTDGDNIPDDYETANGLNPNSNADRNTDLDGDGQSNYLEFVAGTQANNPASVLQIVSASLSAGNEIALTWTSVAGKKYLGQISTDIGNTNPWTALGTPITATGTTTSVPPGIIIPAGNPRYFMRVIVVP